MVKNNSENSRLTFHDIDDVLNYAEIGIFRTNIEGKFLYANDALIKMFGANSFKELAVNGIAPIYKNPDDRKYFLASLRKNGFVRTYELELNSRSGESKFAIINASLNGQIISGALMDITERKLIEEKLSEEENRFKVLVQASPDCIKLLDLDGKVVYMNPSGLVEHGLANDHLDGRGYDYLSSIVKEDRVKAQKAFTKAKNGKFVDCSVRHLPNKANRNWCLMSFAPILNNDGKLINMFAVSRDISPLKRVEASLRESEERYSNLIQSSSDAIISIDSEFKIRLWNPAAERIFGYTDKEVLSKHIKKIIPKKYKAIVDQKIKNFYNADENQLIGIVIEADGLKKDGKEIPIELSLSFKKCSNGYSATAIIRDNTERKNSEKAIQEKISESERLNKYLLNRELKMIELKKELLKIKKKL